MLGIDHHGTDAALTTLEMHRKLWSSRRLMRNAPFGFVYR